MVLSYDDLELILLCIFTESKIVYIDSINDYVVFKHANNRYKLLSNMVYTKAYKDAISDGLLPIDELKTIIEKRNIFTAKDKESVIKIQNQINAQQVVLAKTTKVKANMDRVKSILSRLEQELANVQFKLTSKLIMSADTKAADTKNHFLCQLSTFKIDDALFWPMMQNMKSELNIESKNEILNKFLEFQNGVDTTSIRCLARYGPWRIRYISSVKTGEQLFGKPTTDYTIDQLNLFYWSNFYSNLYDMMPEDRPSDAIIEDDESLDAFMKDYDAVRSKEEASRKTTKQTSGEMSAFDKDEVIVTQSHELYHDIKYDTPREAQQIKNRSDIKKRTIHS